MNKHVFMCLNPRSVSDLINFSNLINMHEKQKTFFLNCTLKLSTVTKITRNRDTFKFCKSIKIVIILLFISSEVFSFSVIVKAFTPHISRTIGYWLKGSQIWRYEFHSVLRVYFAAISGISIRTISISRPPTDVRERR